MTYDTDLTDQDIILAFVEEECRRAFPARRVRARVNRTRQAETPVLVSHIGKMALGVLVNKGVSYSISSLLGARA